MTLILGYYGVGKTTIKNERWADLTDEGRPSLSLLMYAVKKYDVVMADPTWEDVFVKSGLPFHVVVPSVDRKEEFLRNYRDRHEKGLGGGDPAFCSWVSERWFKDIKRMLSLKAVSQTVLHKGMWLSDCIQDICKSD